MALPVTEPQVCSTMVCLASTYTVTLGTVPRLMCYGYAMYVRTGYPMALSAGSVYRGHRYVGPRHPIGGLGQYCMPAHVYPAHLGHRYTGMA